MTHDGELRILRRHAAAIVRDADVGESAVRDLHLYIARAGIHGIFYHFLDGVHRTLHHFTGGDLIRRHFIEYMDQCH